MITVHSMIARILITEPTTTETYMKFRQNRKIPIVYNLNFIFCIIIERSILKNTNVLMVWI